jgi:hypothetical protein
MNRPVQSPAREISRRYPDLPGAVTVANASLLNFETLSTRWDDSSSYQLFVTVADGTDPLQLAIYRQAWAEVCRIPPERVDAVFYLVATDSVVRPERLPGRAEIARLVAGSEPDEPTADLV